MTGIAVTGLTVQFGGVSALSEVDVEIAPRSVHAVVGPNGAGKSTLLNAINGFVPITDGTILLGEEHVDRQSPARIASGGVRRSFQSPRLVESLSVEANLMYGLYDSMAYSWMDQALRPWRVKASEREGRARSMELLRAVSLDGDAHTVVGALPYGVKKLVEILRALMPRAPIVLLDEPSSGLGSDERSDLCRMLKQQLDDAPATVVLVEHHMDVVRAIASHATVLKAGAVAESGPVAQVFSWS